MKYISILKCTSFSKGFICVYIWQNEKSLWTLEIFIWLYCACVYSVGLQVIHSCNAVKGVSCIVLLVHPPKMLSMPLPVHFQNCSENKQRKTAKASEFWSDQGHALLNGNPTIQYFWRIPGKNIMKKTYSPVDQSNIQSIEYLAELLSSIKQTNKHKSYIKTSPKQTQPHVLNRGACCCAKYFFILRASRCVPKGAVSLFSNSFIHQQKCVIWKPGFPEFFVFFPECGAYETRSSPPS